jgi:hypothetical protein
VKAVDHTALDAACPERLERVQARRAGKIVDKAVLINDQPVVADLTGRYVTSLLGLPERPGVLSRVDQVLNETTATWPAVKRTRVNVDKVEASGLSDSVVHSVAPPGIGPAMARVIELDREVRDVRPGVADHEVEVDARGSSTAHRRRPAAAAGLPG